MRVNSFKYCGLGQLSGVCLFFHKVTQRTNAKEAERSAEETLRSQLPHCGVGEPAPAGSPSSSSHWHWNGPERRGHGS